MLSLFQNVLKQRFLLGRFVRTDVVGRYKASFLGVFWMILNPLILFGLYVFVFSVILKVRFPEHGGIFFYSLNLFCGLIAWNAFAEGLTRSSSAIVNHSNLLKRTLFPTEILGLSMAMSSIVRFLVELVLFIIILFFLGYRITWAFCWLPFLILLQLLFTISLCWIFSVIGVIVKDMAQLIGPMMTAWFFLTPVVYPESMALVTSKWGFLATLIHLNPMAKFVSTYRGILLFGYFDFTPAMIYLITFVLGLFLSSAWFFSRMKSELVENL